MILTFSTSENSTDKIESEIDLILTDNILRITTQRGRDASTYLSFSLNIQDIKRLKEMLNCK